jgi:DNA-binding beta-propeller fold protein YncE
VTISSGIITAVAGTGTAGYIGNGFATSATLNYPSGLATDISGNVYIADTYNNVVRKLTVSNGFVVALTNIGDLNSPIGVAVDASGNSYIADTGDGVIKKVATGAGTINTAIGCNTSCNYAQLSIWHRSRCLSFICTSWSYC